MQVICHIKVKDIRNIDKSDCGPFCVPLLPDRRLKGLS